MNALAILDAPVARRPDGYSQALAAIAPSFGDPRVADLALASQEPILITRAGRMGWGLASAFARDPSALDRFTSRAFGDEVRRLERALNGKVPNSFGDALSMSFLVGGISYELGQQSTHADGYERALLGLVDPHGRSAPAEGAWGAPVGGGLGALGAFGGVTETVLNYLVDKVRSMGPMISGFFCRVVKAVAGDNVFTQALCSFFGIIIGGVMTVAATVISALGQVLLGLSELITTIVANPGSLSSGWVEGGKRLLIRVSAAVVILLGAKFADVLKIPLTPSERAELVRQRGESVPMDLQTMGERLGTRDPLWILSLVASVVSFVTITTASAGLAAAQAGANVVIVCAPAFAMIMAPSLKANNSYGLSAVPIEGVERAIELVIRLLALVVGRVIRLYDAIKIIWAKIEAYGQRVRTWTAAWNDLKGRFGKVFKERLERIWTVLKDFDFSSAMSTLKSFLAIGAIIIVALADDADLTAIYEAGKQITVQVSNDVATVKGSVKDITAALRPGERAVVALDLYKAACTECRNQYPSGWETKCPQCVPEVASTVPRQTPASPAAPASDGGGGGGAVAAAVAAALLLMG